MFRLLFRVLLSTTLLTVYFGVSSEEILAKTDKAPTGLQFGRALRDDSGSDQWRAVEEHHVESSGWIGTDQDEKQPQKRRRLRKRKRRPQIITEASDIEMPRPRRRRPVRLDEMRDSWRELEEETPKRTYNRRRISPVYKQDDGDGIVSASIKFANEEDKIRDPLLAMKDAEEKMRRKKVQNTTGSATADIKTLLKQNGGLSLSEILQQRNLSLSDLLKGKKQAISALSEPEPEVMASRNYESDNDSLEEAKKENLEVQRKRLSMLYNHKENKIYSDVTKYDVITESTTEKRIFVPSHPKYYTSINYRPEIGITERITESIPKFTTSRTPNINENIISRKYAKLPITSAKIHQTVKKPMDDHTKLPPKAFKINLNDLVGFSDVISKEDDKSDGPFKMSFDIEAFTAEQETTTLKTTTTKRTTTAPTTIKTTTTTSTTTTTTVAPTTKNTIKTKLQPISAKDEVMEILSDESSKLNLTRILEMRNMTVQEFIEQRERGSSQIHLADIFHNNTKEPEPQHEHIVEVKMDSERQPKSSKILEDLNLKPLPDVSISSEEIVTSEKIPGTSFPTYKIEMNRHTPVPKSIWKSIYPDPILKKDIQQFQEIENSIAEAVNEELGDGHEDEDVKDEQRKSHFDYDDYIQLPMGVKSAIFASLAIIGISLFVFVTILVIFRCSQKHKKRLCYAESSFSCSKIKSPILENDPKTTIRSFMSETLGKKKNVYSSHQQSMSDSWETEKPYQ